MTSVTSAFIKVFESSGFECELIETEKTLDLRVKRHSANALKVANELHRSSHLVKFWVDKKNRSLWAMVNTFVEEETAVDTAVKAVGLLVDYCNRMCPVFEAAMNEG